MRLPSRAVPYLELSEENGGLEGAVTLDELGPDIASVAIVMAPSDAHDDETSAHLDCDPAMVVREFDRAVFDAALEAEPTLTLPFRLEPPEIARDKRYAFRACVRDRKGRLAGNLETRPTIASLPFAGDQRYLEIVDTPSGPVHATWHLTQGYAVIGYDLDARHEVVQHVTKVDHGGPSLALQIESLGTVHVPGTRSFHVAAKGRFVNVKELAVGDLLTMRGGKTARIVASAEAPHDLLVTSFVTDGTGNHFQEGLLVRDETPSKGAAPEWSETSERATWISRSESYDSGLDTMLVVRELPSDAQSVALVVEEQVNDEGERIALACDAGIVVGEIPRSVIDAVSTTKGSRKEDAARLGVRVEQLDSPGYAIIACARGSDGKLTPLADKARYAISGSSSFFAAGTLVSTPEGDIPIERLARGDRLIAYDVDGRRSEVVLVTHVRARVKHDLGVIEFSDGTEIHVTPEHFVFVKAEGSFIHSRAIKIGDELVGIDGRTVHVKRVGRFDGGGEGFDVSVDGLQNYFAGGILVHNY